MNVGRKVRAGGHLTHLYEWGGAHQETVVLLHDGTFGADAFTAFERLGDLLGKRYHVLAPDLLGYGQTDKVVHFDRPPYASRIQHLAALYDTLALTAAIHLVGTSFGGSVALRTLEAGSWHIPLRSVTSISGTGGPWRAPGSLEALLDYEEPSREAMRRLMLRVVDDFSGLDDVVEARYQNTLTPGGFEAVAAMRVRNPSSDSRRVTDPYPDSIRGSELPVLLIAGKNDDLLDEDWADQLAMYLPNARVESLSSGHSPNIDHPDEVGEMLMSFFEQDGSS